jgi:CRP/FNR family transcriptional regulator, cyclic AMP receptor protein
MNVYRLMIFVPGLRIFATMRLVSERINCTYRKSGETMLNDIFLQLSLFQELSPAQLDVLRPLFTLRDYYADRVVFEQGEPADYLYLVVLGEVVVNYKPEDGQIITVARVRPGGIIGWSAAIGRRQYTSAAVCSQYTQLLSVSGKDLQGLCEQYPEIGGLLLQRLADVVAERIQGSHAQVVALLENGLRNGAHNSGGQKNVNPSGSSGAG